MAWQSRLFFFNSAVALIFSKPKFRVLLKVVHNILTIRLVKCASEKQEKVEWLGSALKNLAKPHDRVLPRTN